MARTTPPRPYDARKVREIAESYGIDIAPFTYFKAQIDSRSFAGVLDGTGLLSIAARLMFRSIEYGLTSADARIPRRLTKKDRAAVDLIVLDMSLLKSQLEDMLKTLEGWAESNVAMSAHADGNRERSE